MQKNFNIPLYKTKFVILPDIEICERYVAEHIPQAIPKRQPASICSGVIFSSNPLFVSGNVFLLEMDIFFGHDGDH